MRVPRDLSGLHRPPEPPSDPWPAPGTGTASGPVADGRVLPFRRRSGLPVRRRRRWLALARHFATAAVLVGAPSAALWWSATSPRFDLVRLDVATSDRVNREWVEARLAHLPGQNLVWMSMRSVERSLADHPWIQGVEVSKSLPDRMHVAVVERRPVAVLEASGRRHWVDREGRVIAPIDDREAPPATGEGTEGYLVLAEPAAPVATEERERRLRQALLAAEALGRVDAGWSAGLERIEILGDDDLRMLSRRMPFPLLVEAGTVEERVRVLRRRLPEILARVPDPEGIDLRFEHRMVVRQGTGGTGVAAHAGRGELHGQTG